jgi:transposase
VVANPRRVRAYARSQGLLAKTDRIDASLIGEFADGSKRLREHAAPAPAEEQLRILHQAREALVDALKREAVLAEHAPCAGTPAGKQVRKLAEKRRRLLERQIGQLDQAIAALMAADANLGRRAARLRQIKGVGPVCVAAALCLMPELGTLEKGQAAALAGVAPPPDQSGAADKPRHIEGGRHRMRRILYMAALSAALHNPVLKPYYQRLRQRGKPVKVALTAVMRKLIELFNHLLKYPNFSLAS